jgi:hypothetical protein
VALNLNEVKMAIISGFPPIAESVAGTPVEKRIGIVVCCAGEVVLIIVLALYFSPMREKVFPYAKR